MDALQGRITPPMRRALTIALAVVALPLFAEEKKTTTQQTTTTAAAPAQQDSPLVAAAKRSKRLGKKPTNVITNETLTKAGGNVHVTTTTEQREIRMPKPLDPPTPTLDMAAARMAEAHRKQLAEIEAKRKKAEETKQRAAAAAAARSEEGLYDGEDVDPAQAEQGQENASQQKPPQD